MVRTLDYFKQLFVQGYTPSEQDYTDVFDTIEDLTTTEAVDFVQEIDNELGNSNWRSFFIEGIDGTPLKIVVSKDIEFRKGIKIRNASGTASAIIKADDIAGDSNFSIPNSPGVLLTDTYVGIIKTIDGTVYASSGTTGLGTISRDTSVVGATVQILGDKFKIVPRTGNFVPPSSSTDSGEKGEIRFDDNYMYKCYDTDKWARIPFEKTF